MTRSIPTLLLSLLLAGCAWGLPDTPPPADGEAASPGEGAADMIGVGKAHCDAVNARSVCDEFDQRNMAETHCEKAGGTVDDGACPEGDRLGSCTFNDGVRRFYSSGGSPVAVEAAQQTCTGELNGTFTAG